MGATARQWLQPVNPVISIPQGNWKHVPLICNKPGGRSAVMPIIR